MKTPIEVKDIRKGDLIRFEFNPNSVLGVEAVEYFSPTPGEGYQHKDCGVHYLLERPEPPFEPYWGMVIGEREAHEDDGAGVKAVYVPTGDGYPWFSHPESGSRYYYYSEDWAKQKLAEGWVVIEKPEGVK